MEPLPSLTNNEYMQMMNQEHQLPLLHPQGQMHPLANNSMGASQMLNNSMGARQVSHPPHAPQMLPTLNHQQTPFTTDPMAPMLHGSLLPNQSFSFFPGPSAQHVHGFRHVMSGMAASQHDPSMQPNQEDLQYFLAGRVRPVPGIQIYRCSACGDEFANRHAFGGHMSSHSKKNSSNAKASGSKSSKKKASSSRRKQNK